MKILDILIEIIIRWCIMYLINTRFKLDTSKLLREPQ